MLRQFLKEKNSRIKYLLIFRKQLGLYVYQTILTDILFLICHTPPSLPS